MFGTKNVIMIQKQNLFVRHWNHKVLRATLVNFGLSTHKKPLHNVAVFYVYSAPVVYYATLAAVLFSTMALATLPGTSA